MPILTMYRAFLLMKDVLACRGDDFEKALDKGTQELEKYLIDSFNEGVGSFDAKDAAKEWERWIEVKAHLFWYRAVRRSNNGTGWDDDHYQAKRYLGCLIAQRFLSTNPVESPTPAQARYLVGLSLDEFVRFKAYLAYRDRRMGPAPSYHDMDYQKAMESVHQVVDGWYQQGCRTLPWGKELAIFQPENLHYRARNDAISWIKRAKKNALIRMEAEHATAIVDGYVDTFYRWLAAVPNGSAADSIKLIDAMFDHASVINMLEFLVMCLLAQSNGRKHYGSMRERILLQRLESFRKALVSDEPDERKRTWLRSETRDTEETLQRLRAGG
jgi:hypothetical protein